MTQRIRNYIPIILSLLVLATGVWLKVEEPYAIKRLQYIVFDQYQAHYPRAYEPLGVRVIDIDDESLRRLGQWPWPRDLMARLVTRLQELGAAVQAFDIVFAEPDRTSPDTMAQDWPIDATAREQIKALPNHDLAFAEALAQIYAVTGYVLSNVETGNLPPKKASVVAVGASNAEGEAVADPYAYVAGHYNGAVTNLPILDEVAEGSGYFTNMADEDGLIRRVPLLLGINGEVVPSLAMETLRVLQGAKSYVAKMVGSSDESGSSGEFTFIRNGQLEIPVDRQGNMLMHYTPFTQDRYIPAWEVLEPDFDPSRVEGHILFYGTSAPGLKDLRATPLKADLPGVEVHVQVVEQILAQHFLSRPSVLFALEIVGMVLGGLLAMFYMARLSAVWGACLMASLLCGAVWLSFYLYRTEGLLIDPVTPGLVIAVLYLTESMRRYIISEAQRKQVRGAFSQYMSPALVAKLARDPQSLKLGGEMKHMTVLFCDVRGFTTLSEQYNAEELTKFINSFLTPMTDVILRRKGTIDKYMGDCIMAFWNAPLDDPEHPKNACISALEMIDAVAAINEQRRVKAREEKVSFLPLNIGIGINSGEMCVGNMGSEQRFDYSVLGDEVNLGSRLEGQSKSYGVTVVISAATEAFVPEMATLELDLIMVKGKTKAVRIFALLGDESLAEDERFRKVKTLWHKVLKTYRSQNWDEAENYIALCHTAAHEIDHVNIDGLLALYQERLEAYRLKPPMEHWDGVFQATTK
ncbi:MAG: adenylate/guanylate cyclase domain-containing protein [Rickettsiales bacterium]|nr:adenylate/guanylate cyclase domain-containing protein [Rickettsiales bacterium]